MLSKMRNDLVCAGRDGMSLDLYGFLRKFGQNVKALLRAGSFSFSRWGFVIELNDFGEWMLEIINFPTETLPKCDPDGKPSNSDSEISLNSVLALLRSVSAPTADLFSVLFESF